MTKEQEALLEATAKWLFGDDAHLVPWDCETSKYHAFYLRKATSLLKVQQAAGAVLQIKVELAGERHDKYEFKVIPLLEETK
jgi:hypothetical protein